MKYIFLIFSVIVLAGCAQMYAPTGGDKDVVSPEVVKDKTFPANRSVNFNSKTIDISFNEFIKLNNPAEQIIISPAMEKNPEYVLKGKKLRVVLKSELKPNTTYTINFGNSIADITENNIAEGLTYVFSTGPYLDSLKVSGTVTNAFSNAGEKGVWVFLHQNLSDTALQKVNPDYLAKTDAEGNFNLYNLTAGEYKIYALKDGNSDFKYNQPSEDVAFLNESILVGEKSDPVNLRLFNETSETQFVKSSRFTWPGKMQMVMNKTYEYWDARILPYDTISKSFHASIYKNAAGDTIDVWLRKPATVSGSEIRVVLPITRDSLNKKSDTVSFTVSGIKDEVPPMKLKTNASNNFGLYDALKMKYDRPAMLFKKEKLHLFKNDSVEIQAETKVLGYGSSLVNQWEGKTDYKIVLEDSAFADVFYGKYSKADTITFSTVKKDFYGNILADVSVPDTNYTLELTGANERLIYRKQIKENGKIVIEHLRPGNYKMKIYHNPNGNWKWDTGNFVEKKQPEKIWYYKETIVIRSNWDYDLNWKIQN